MRGDNRGKSDPNRKKRESRSPRVFEQVEPEIIAPEENEAPIPKIDPKMLVEAVKYRKLIDRISKTDPPSRRAMLRREKKTLADIYKIE